MEKIFDSNEIDILLLKLLHGGSKEELFDYSQADRAEQMGISVNALQSRIHALEEGKDILGHHVQIQTGGRGQVAYDNTIHPVFLTLNLKEVYLLTIALQQLSRETPYESLAKDVSNDIYSQLSGYAQSIIDTHANVKDITLTAHDKSKPIPYRDEQHDLIYFLKSGDNCLLQLIDGTSFHGKIVCTEMQFSLITTDGRQIPIPEDSSLYSLHRA